MFRSIITALSAAAIMTAAAQTDFKPEEHSTFTTDRPDGRYTSSRAIAPQLMASKPPRLQYKSTFDATQAAEWRKEMSAAMARVMNHPDTATVEKPQLTGTWQRDGYRLERWESYPFAQAVVPFLVLVPDGVSASNPAPAIMCIPGSGQTKELLAGETRVDLDSSETKPTRNAQAYEFVKQGYIAVAVDNPACGEPADLEVISGGGGWDYVTFSRALLELGWNYLGYASYVDQQILNWMRTMPEARRDRIVVSGFSLGTEPLMALGLMNPDIYAFVYNDFLCTTRERALVMTLPDANGRRPWPNDISHLIPEFLVEFDFPDIVAALAPRPVICTEGGLDRDFKTIADAYATSGAPEAFEYHHYAKFVDPADRVPIDTMPAGINRDTFFRLANVDPPRHYFQSEHVLPWLKKILAD